MSSVIDLHGVYVPLVTPFTADDRVAHDEIEAMVDRYLDQGAAGIVALGTTGEPATLEPTERSEVLQTIGRVCKDRSAHFSVGAGTNNTNEALVLQEQAIAAGADSILSVAPYYTRPSEAGILAHYQRLAAASSVPLIVYNVPYRTGRNLGADVLLELAHTPNIAGLKQAVGGVDVDTARVLAEKPSDFAILCGDDAFIFPLMAMGASGAIAASSHVCTSGFVAMVNAALKSDWQVAREIHETLLPVCTALFAEPSPAVIKAVLQQLGVQSTSSVRMPMTPASSAATQTAVEVVATAMTALVN